MHDWAACVKSQSPAIAMQSLPFRLRLPSQRAYRGSPSHLQVGSLKEGTLLARGGCILADIM